MNMASSKESLNIEKLNQANYSIWKFKLEMLLIKEDLYEFITNDPPETINNEWSKKDNKARAIINLSIDDSQIVYVKNEVTAKNTWDALRRIHERSNLSSKLYLLRKLYSAKLDEGGNMINHITKILEISDKLKAIGENIDDSHLSALLLCSLPASYDTLITALEARPENELNSEFIKGKLTDEFFRRTETSNVSIDNATRAYKTKENKYYTKRNNDKFCTYCHKRNHDKFQCWHLRNKNSFPAKNQSKNYVKYKQNSSLCFETNQRSSENKFSNRGKSNDSNSKEDSNIRNKFNTLALLANKGKTYGWIIDSGSSSHICNNKHLFTDMKINDQNCVTVANGNTLNSLGSGTVELKTKTSDGEINNITLKDVLYVPEIETNLLSVRKATQNGCSLIFKDEGCKLIYDGKIFLEGRATNNLYEIILDKSENKDYAQLTHHCLNKNCINLWHSRLGHKNINSIKEIISKKLASGLRLENCNHDTICENCIKSKMTDAPYPKETQHRAKRILDLVHSDICGPIKTPTIGQKTYFLTFIDDFSRYTFIYLLSKKSEVLEKLKEYVAIVLNKFGRIPQCIRTDNGGEYVNREIENYMIEMGIKHQLTVPHCPSQNGVAERKNRSLVEMTRTMLTEAHLPHRFWGEAINSANYLQNRLLTKANPCTPYELWSNRKPDYTHLRVFGCKAFAYIDKSKRTKLDNKSQVGTFVGYDNHSKGYRIYCEGKHIIIARTVKFLENEFLYANIEHKDNSLFENATFNQNNSQSICSENEETITEIEMGNHSDNNHTQSDDVETQPRRSERSNKGVPPDRLIYLTYENKIDEPKSWEELKNINNPIEKENWLKATKEEIKSLKHNNTWQLVDPPVGKRVIGNRWTFKVKYNSEGEVEKYKARLVAKGYSQKYGEDYDETYAPVVSHTTIRAFLAKAAHEKLEVNHLDVKTAFLHGELEEEVYMKQPEGYVIPGMENKICKLNKAIYGLKQAARAWHIKIANTLKSLEFEQSNAEQCLFKRKKGNDTVYIIVYVDDILIAGKQNEINEIVEKLQEDYEIKNLGQIKHYLGINIRKTNEGYALNQKIKINEIVHKYNLKDSKPCNTPMEPGYKNTNDNENSLPNNHQYRKAIGSLLYIATTCRPDICAAINILSRRNENPRRKDWEQVKRVIRYLNTTSNLELFISSKTAPVLTAYADADWGGDETDRKSTSGNLFLLGETPIHWITKKQTSVSLSSAEAEYISAANAAQEILWLLKLLKDLDLSQPLPIILYEDNQSTIKMINSQKYSNRTKHVDIKYHCVKDLQSNGTIQLKYCPTKIMLADMLTKPVPKPELQRHRDLLQLLQKQQLHQ